MNSIQRYSVLGCCVILFAQQAAAIPAFARKYDMSCNTCHAAVPKLKPYGEEFAGNGFRLEGKEPPRFLRETGDDWLQLMRELPLAIRLEGHAAWEPQKTGKTDFQAPWILKLLSGGVVTERVSYYFYFFFSEKGEQAGIEDAFLQYNNFFDIDLDLTVGQFQVSDPLFKRELRLSRADYLVYGLRPPDSRIDLKYDRGIVLSLGLPTGTDLVLEGLNGNGIGSLEGGSFDRDQYKNVMFRVSQEAGEMIRLGGFGYVGKEAGGLLGATNSVWMAGPDATVSLGPVEVNAQYVERRDGNPSFLAAGGKTAATRGAFVEMLYSPDWDHSRWYGVLLWNWGESEFHLETLGRKYQTGTGHVGYLLARNLRLTAEYTYDFLRKANTISVGFVSAF